MTTFRAYKLDASADGWRRVYVFVEETWRDALASALTYIGRRARPDRESVQAAEKAGRMTLYYPGVTWQIVSGDAQPTRPEDL